MAKKFGKGRKKAAGGADPRDMFGTTPPPRQVNRPASSNPLADYLRQNLPGVDSGYVVLPRSLAENMSLPWQQQLVALLSQFHSAHAQLSWPLYRVMPSRQERLVDLDEEQLAEVGYLAEIDVEGNMVYRERSGRKVDDPENVVVLVSCLDPIPNRGRRALPSVGATSREPAESNQSAMEPAPMNIGPAPVWQTTAQPDRRQPDPRQVPAGKPQASPGPRPQHPPLPQPSARLPVPPSQPPPRPPAGPVGQPQTSSPAAPGPAGAPAFAPPPQRPEPVVGPQIQQPQHSPAGHNQSVPQPPQPPLPQPQSRPKRGASQPETPPSPSAASVGHRPITALDMDVPTVSRGGKATASTNPGWFDEEQPTSTLIERGSSRKPASDGDHKSD